MQAVKVYRCARTPVGTAGVPGSVRGALSTVRASLYTLTVHRVQKCTVGVDTHCSEDNIISETVACVLMLQGDLRFWRSAFSRYVCRHVHAFHFSRNFGEMKIFVEISYAQR